MSAFIGRYELGELLGSGASASVYRARDPGNAEAAEVAIKVLHPHLAKDSIIRRRFLREAEIAGRLLHPRILPIYEVADGEEGPAAIMEYCPGGSLAEAGPLPQDRLVDIARSVAAALAAAHAQGVVHRDVRPAKLLVDRGGGIKLCGFGSARVSTMIGLTRSTMFTSRCEFTPPESLLAPYSDPRWDLYSLGATLRRLATGKSRGAEPSIADLVSGRAGAFDPSELTSIGIEGWFAGLIADLLKPIDERPRSAEEVLAVLNRGISRASIEVEARPSIRTKECLFCGAQMPFGSPLCLACGQEDIVIEPYEAWDAQSVIIQKIPENSQVMERLGRTIRALAGDPSLGFEFMTEDGRLYSAEEKKGKIALPARLVDDLSPAVADRIIDLLHVQIAGKAVTVTRKPTSSSRKTGRRSSSWRNAAALITPRRCPKPEPLALAGLRSAASKALSLPEDADRGLYLAALSSPSASAEAGSEGFERLASSLCELLAEAAEIRRGLDSVSLGEAYASVREAERRIAESDDGFEIQGLIDRKLELERLIERYHEQDIEHALLVERAARAYLPGRPR